MPVSAAGKIRLDALISKSDSISSGLPVPSADETNDHPVEQVRLTVPITDDPTLPVLTFRTWTLGISSCIALALVSQFYGFRVSGPVTSPVPVLLIVLPIGKLMAAVLPTKNIRVPATRWSFSLNPGPFNVKEHVLIGIFATTASSLADAMGIVTQMMAFYHKELNPMAAILLTMSSQFIGGPAHSPEDGWPKTDHIFLVVPASDLPIRQKVI